ncbi:MAG: Na(+)-translocating NADH-quinone reductase subunit A, partial [Pseudomonadota bacterium]|nr:Na(+)-translocating NADH-quinone reductase subunit A [Pseudomonadota bacterium]
FTAPAAGAISAIHRGAKRALQSVVIDVDEAGGAVAFPVIGPEAIAGVERSALVEALVASGLWTALRTRPFSRIPERDSMPAAIFVTAMDTQPLAADPVMAVADQPDALSHGLDALARLTEGKVYLCTAPGVTLPTGSDARIQQESFAGPHPAGLPGTHIHCLEPVSAQKSVWHIALQDVVALGRTLLDGELYTQRVVALGGPAVTCPRLLRTVLGASIDELTAGELSSGDLRVLSGSVFSGRSARGALAFLGRYHSQISVLAEDRSRPFLHYLRLGSEAFSVLPVFLSRLAPKKRFPFTTSANGSARAMVPVGAYEAVVPLDILPTQLLRSLLVGDIETSIALGALELDEEDLALCTFACPGKYEYGPVLRGLLDRIEKEG